MTVQNGQFDSLTYDFSKLIQKTIGPQSNWPSEGLSEFEIKILLNFLAKMDSNNLPGNIGAGEREGRVYSKLVSDRWYGLSHGVGRSGNLTEAQPKAKGSSIIQSTANNLVKQALRVTLKHIECCLISPLATGMSLLLCLLTLKSIRPIDAKYVIQTRVDQKSGLKAIVMGSLTPVIVEMKLIGDELLTDIQEIQNQIDNLGSENIVCVMATTSCFAPRGVDDLESIGKICHHSDVPLLVNNAYGLQSTVCCSRIDQAAIGKDSRVDLVVQSCDKNFMVPVGGAIIASYDESLLLKVKNMYSGRASMGPSLDILITLLQMGRNGYLELLKTQQTNFVYLKTKMCELAQKHGERILSTKTNKISLAMTLNSFNEHSSELTGITVIGSKIFISNISGARVVDSKKQVKIGNLSFNKYGAHCDDYPHVYLNVSCAIGMVCSEIDQLVKKIDKILLEIKKKNLK